MKHLQATKMKNNIQTQKMMEQKENKLTQC